MNNIRNSPLTFVDPETEVALPTPHIDKCDKRVDVCSTRPTPYYNTRLNHRQLL